MLQFLRRRSSLYLVKLNLDEKLIINPTNKIAIKEGMSGIGEILIDNTRLGEKLFKIKI
jgi:hypothetical protein